MVSCFFCELCSLCVFCGRCRDWCMKNGTSSAKTRIAESQWLEMSAPAIVVPPISDGTDSLRSWAFWLKFFGKYWWKGIRNFLLC